MSPLDLFNPQNALNPTAFAGAAGASRLMDAARQFPGGPVMLVFALFWAPVGPGIPAGVLLAHHLRLSPVLTFGLYVLSDVLAAIVCHPIFTLLRRHGRRVPVVRAFGKRLLRFAMIGVRPPRAGDLVGGRMAPALFRIGTVGFGVDVYTAGALGTGLPLARVPAWAAAIGGDLVWFAVLLGSSIAAAQVTDDDRWVAGVVIVVMLVVPPLARRFIPALRDDP
jgi:hypothetical protein